MNITKKQVYLSSFTIIVILVMVWGFLPSPIPVNIKQVQEAPLKVTIEEEGITRVTDRYTISAPVTGYVLRIQHEIGDSVETGQELFRIQPLPDLISARQREVSEAQLQAAKARLNQAKENLNLAEEEKRIADIELQRIQRLFESGIGSEQGLDQAKLTARRAAAQTASAEFTVNVAEFEIRATRSALQAFQTSSGQEQISINAPVDGRLLKIHHQSEGTVQAGTPILEIGDPYSLEIKVDLLSTDVVQVDQGTKVRIKRWGSDRILNGTVKVVEPAGYTRISALGVEEQRVPTIITIQSSHEEWKRLGDGYRVVAEFIIWESDQVLQVPSSSLFRTGGEQWAIFVVDNGTAQLRNVEIGQQSGLQTQIISGLEPGESVITHPDERIEDEVKVESRN